ncbi:MAG: hypothetical protein ISP90_01295 [Nevskia sp.]|nr:hypothetical protein [Nevskia sp.]
MIKRVMRSSLPLFVAAAVGGCSATPEKPASSQPGLVYDKPAAEVQQAAVDALTANGFNINSSQPIYVEGSRPHKVGLLVGSGGETVGVWLESLSPTRTGVKVDTAKSIAGIAGQKSWNSEIVQAMDKSVGPHE